MDAGQGNIALKCFQRRAEGLNLSNRGFYCQCQKTFPMIVLNLVHDWEEYQLAGQTFMGIADDFIII